MHDWPATIQWPMDADPAEQACADLLQVLTRLQAKATHPDPDAAAERQRCEQLGQELFSILTRGGPTMAAVLSGLNGMLQEHHSVPRVAGEQDVETSACKASALQIAQRVGEDAARVGFDWPDLAGPRAKIDEELVELDQAIRSGDTSAIEDELGDVLFSLVNLARHLQIPAEAALKATIDKFRSRFAHVERALEAKSAGWTIEEMERLWQQAKNV